VKNYVKPNNIYVSVSGKFLPDIDDVVIFNHPGQLLQFEHIEYIINNIDHDDDTKVVMLDDDDLFLSNSGDIVRQYDCAIGVQIASNDPSYAYKYLELDDVDKQYIKTHFNGWNPPLNPPPEHIRELMDNIEYFGDWSGSIISLGLLRQYFTDDRDNDYPIMPEEDFDFMQIYFSYKPSSKVAYVYRRMHNGKRYYMDDA
jgi:hypothetical protein